MNKQELERAWSNYFKKRSPENKRPLVAHYFEFVQHIANNVAQKLNWRVPVDELTSHGIDGLYSAIEAFDHKRGIKFETYAYRRVQGSMIDAMRAEDWVPRSVRQRQEEINNKREALEAQRGEKVHMGEVLQSLAINEVDYHKNVSKYRAAGRSSIENCINTEVENDNKKDFNKYLECKNISQQDSKLVRREFLSKLMGKDFSTLERKIIYYYYYEDLTMKEIAAKLNISESRISQIHQQVIKRLKVRVEVNPDYFSKDIVEVMQECNSKDSLY